MADDFIPAKPVFGGQIASAVGPASHSRAVGQGQQGQATNPDGGQHHHTPPQDEAFSMSLLALQAMVADENALPDLTVAERQEWLVRLQAMQAKGWDHVPWPANLSLLDLLTKIWAYHQQL